MERRALSVLVLIVVLFLGFLLGRGTSPVARETAPSPVPDRPDVARLERDLDRAVVEREAFRAENVMLTAATAPEEGDAPAPEVVPAETPWVWSSPVAPPAESPGNEPSGTASSGTVLQVTPTLKADHLVFTTNRLDESVVALGHIQIFLQGAEIQLRSSGSKEKSPGQQTAEARRRLKEIDAAVRAFRKDATRLPGTVEELTRFAPPKPYLGKLGPDPWGGRYEIVPREKGYRLVSPGPDGAVGTEDDVVLDR